MRGATGVPALGEHQDRYCAGGGVLESALDADGVQHFAQRVLVREALGLPAVAGAFDDLPAKLLNLGQCFVVERHDVRHAHEAGHDALQHLPLRLLRAGRRARCPASPAA